MPADLRLVINGDARRVPPLADLAALLAHLDLRPETVVVEHNRRIVRRAELAQTAVADGDTIEIVHFVGGG